MDGKRKQSIPSLGIRVVADDCLVLFSSGEKEIQIRLPLVLAGQGLIKTNPWMHGRTFYGRTFYGDKSVSSQWWITDRSCGSYHHGESAEQGCEPHC
jgi:hypothetical protein